MYIPAPGPPNTNITFGFVDDIKYLEKSVIY